MKIVYSLPHPADRLDSEQAGHTVRARAMLAALERLGHEVIRVEAAAASSQQSQKAVSAYRTIIKGMLPRPVAMRLRDTARVAFSRRYAARLSEIVREQKPDVILETHIAFSLAGKLASEATSVPLVLDDVAPAWEEEQQYGVGAKKLALSIHHDVTSQASVVVAVSGAIRRLLIEDGIPAQKVVTISNGIDDSFFDQAVDGQVRRKALNLPDDAVVIVFVGSFQPYHHVDWLLEAFARMKADQPAHLLLVGEGKRTPEAKALAEQLGLMPCVTFAGRVPYQDVASYVAAGNAAIMPATNSYGNPMKLYEYMALGKPIIAPDQETITEIVTHNRTAILFKPDDIEDMAAALAKVAGDGALRSRLGAQAGDEAHQHTWMKRGEQMQAALRQAIG